MLVQLVERSCGRHQLAEGAQFILAHAAVRRVKDQPLPHGAGRIRHDADDLLVRAEQQRELLETHAREHGDEDALGGQNIRLEALDHADDHLRLDAEKDEAAKR